jgi:hypothetical protein
MRENQQKLPSDDGLGGSARIWIICDARVSLMGGIRT